MNEVWWVATLWSLMGLAAILIAMWVGGSLRDEISRVRAQIARRSKTLRAIQRADWTVVNRPAAFRSGLFALRRSGTHVN